MSLAPSPSSSAPATLSVTFCVPAWSPPTVKLLPAPVTVICTAPLAAAVCTTTLAPALRFKIPVVALLSVSTLAWLR